MNMANLSGLCRTVLEASSTKMRVKTYKAPFTSLILLASCTFFPSHSLLSFLLNPLIAHSESWRLKFCPTIQADFIFALSWWPDSGHPVSITQQVIKLQKQRDPAIDSMVCSRFMAVHLQIADLLSSLLFHPIIPSLLLAKSHRATNAMALQ